MYTYISKYINVCCVCREFEGVIQTVSSNKQSVSKQRALSMCLTITLNKDQRENRNGQTFRHIKSHYSVPLSHVGSFSGYLGACLVH